MTHPGGGAKYHWHLILFREIESIGHHITGFLRRGRVQAGYAGKLCIPPVILLVLGRMASGIIGRDYDQAAFNACICKGHERVRGHVKTYVFHGSCAAAPRP